jgi:hypothetical protein
VRDFAQRYEVGGCHVAQVQVGYREAGVPESLITFTQFNSLFLDCHHIRRSEHRALQGMREASGQVHAEPNGEHA